MSRRVRTQNERAPRQGSPTTKGVPASGMPVIGRTKEQMAAALQISVRTLERMIRRKEIAHFKIGKLVRFKWSDVEADMREHCLVRSEEKGGRA